jgi:hypothetical protein
LPLLFVVGFVDCMSDKNISLIFGTGAKKIPRVKLDAVVI